MFYRLAWCKNVIYYTPRSVYTWYTKQTAIVFRISGDWLQTNNTRNQFHAFVFVRVKTSSVLHAFTKDLMSVKEQEKS